MTQAFRKQPAANNRQPGINAASDKRRQQVSPEGRAKQLAGTKAYWAKKNAAKACAAIGQDKTKPEAASPAVAAQGNVTPSAGPNQSAAETTNTSEQVAGQSASSATTGELGTGAEASQTVTVAADRSEQPAGAQDDAGRSESTAIVLYRPEEAELVARMGSVTPTPSLEVERPESGQFAQIPLTAAPNPAFRQEAVEEMTDERLDRYIVGHFVGLKKNLIALAEALAEKKSRLVRKGREGKWSTYVKYEVGMSVSWADRLVANWNRYLQLGARIREAAEQAGVNITKPAVMDLLQSFNTEFLSTVEPSEKRFAACVLALQEAGKRKQKSNQATDESESDSDAGESDSGSWDAPEPEEESYDDGNGNSSGSNGKTVSLRFTSQQAEEFDELIEDLKERMGTQDRSNIVLHSLCLVRELELVPETPKA